MGPVWLGMRAELRLRWRAMVGLGLTRAQLLRVVSWQASALAAVALGR
jgi:hypothetical protein